MVSYMKLTCKLRIQLPFYNDFNIYSEELEESSSAVQCHMLSVFLLEENMNFLKRCFLGCEHMMVCSFYHDRFPALKI